MHQTGRVSLDKHGGAPVFFAISSKVMPDRICLCHLLVCPETGGDAAATREAFVTDAMGIFNAMPLQGTDDRFMHMEPMGAVSSAELLVFSFTEVYAESIQGIVGRSSIGNAVIRQTRDKTHKMTTDEVECLAHVFFCTLSAFLTRLQSIHGEACESEESCGGRTDTTLDVEESVGGDRVRAYPMSFSFFPFPFWVCFLLMLPSHVTTCAGRASSRQAESVRRQRKTPSSFFLFGSFLRFIFTRNHLCRLSKFSSSERSRSLFPRPTTRCDPPFSHPRSL
jgi:hypothetical protein